MRVISSKEYAEMVEDTICLNIEDAIEVAYGYLARSYDFCDDYYERERRALAISEELRESGAIARIRDEAIKLFEKYGMDIRPDGKDF